MVAVAERLYRSRDDRMLAGVAAGVAETLDADPSLVRIVWALLAIFTGGIAFVVYIVMAIVVPEAPPDWGSSVPPAGAPPRPSVGPSASPDATGAGSPAASTPPPSYWTSDREARRAARRARRDAREPGRGGLIVGITLIVIGGAFLLREFVPWFDWRVWWPVALITLGGLFLVFAMRPSRPGE
jgi:phage shock protein C